MKRILMILGILVALSGAAAASDAWQWLGPQYSNTAVIAVDADGAIFIAGLYMGVVVSEDDGLTWTSVGGPGDPTEMVATTDGTVVATDNWGYGVWVTADKGVNWSRVIVHDQYEWVSQLAVHPLTGDIYAAVNNGGGIHYSYDGGYSWHPVAANLICTEYWDLAAGGNAGIWVKGDSGLWRSDDYAASWVSLPVPPEAELGGQLSFAPSFALFLVGYDADVGYSHLLRSWDFGQTWLELTDGLPGQEWRCFGDIVFGQDWGTMLMADDCNGVYRSENMGDNWAPYMDGLTATDVIALVNGPRSDHYAASMSGGVFRNLRDATSAPDAPVASRLMLEQNHPNPFNPKTTIGFTLAAPGPLSLTLYDARGRLVRTLARGRFEAGPHSILLDAHGLASGSYVYRLQANGEAQARRLMVLK